MPENPETARATDTLRSKLVNPDGKPLYLTNLIKYSSLYADVNIETFRGALDTPLINIFCKGKSYFFIFGNSSHSTENNPDNNSDPNSLYGIRAHHGMKGHWLMEHPTEPANVHFRLDFSFNIPDPTTPEHEIIPDKVLYFYNEQFGQFELFTGKDAIQSSLDKIAKGFLGPFILTKEEWAISIVGMTETRYLRSVLMSQTDLCSGIGNYLLAEILYRAKLHPNVTLGQLSMQEKVQLYDICMSTITGHYNGSIEKVIYQKKYSPAGQPIDFLKLGGRRVWYSPTEQLERT